MSHEPIELRPVGTVASPLVDPADAPKQGDEGAPDAWLVLDGEVCDGLLGIEPGDDLIVLTWFHLASRDVLQVHPRGDEANPLRGIFGTRSPNRPNPIGLHPVEVAEVEGDRVKVHGLDAVDGTPILDIKTGQTARFRAASG